MESNEQNVLVSSAGSTAGIGAIKSLRLIKHGGTIVSIDSNELSAGLYLADKGYVVPPAKSPAFSEVVRLNAKT
jgi:carbamoyl-phosphate synthase large subunit